MAFFAGRTASLDRLHGKGHALLLYGSMRMDKSSETVFSVCVCVCFKNVVLCVQQEENMCLVGV